MSNRKWLWALAALPLVGLPLIAQEAATTPPEPAVPQQAPAPEPKPADTDGEQEDADQASSDDKRPADERMSADNNISFPVDI